MKHTVALAIVATLFTPLSAGTAAASHRAPTVTITFTANLEGATTRECSLEVTKGADGIHVLQAAVDQGCISTYQISASRYPAPGTWPIDGWEPSPKGHHWLRCIDAICDVGVAPGAAPGEQWDVLWDEDRDSDSYWKWGLEAYAASPRDAFVADLRGYW